MLRHDVEHPVIAVCEINIGMTRLAKHDLGARRNSGFGVTGQILLADVGFGLRDETNKFLPIQNANQPCADQFTRNRQSWTIIKRTREEFQELTTENTESTEFRLIKRTVDKTFYTIL